MSVQIAFLTFVFLCYATIIFGQQNLFENDVCDRNGSTPWTCQLADQCPHFSDDLESGKRPRTCGYNGSDPIVCCNMRPSDAWCRYYKREICGEFHSTVFGGETSLAKEFPHMASIGYGNESEKSWQCGGSLISDQFVLSAAHCAQPGGQIGPARWVRLGDLDLSSNDDDAMPEDFSIIQRIVHPEYDPVFLYSDIALFKLDRKVNFNDYIRPACLHQSPTMSTRKATVTGWGRLEFVGPTSAALMKAEVSLFSNDDCVSLTGKNAQLPVGVDSKSQLCAGEKDGAKDTCQGDSGGPLTTPEKCMATQLGITSFGKQCGRPEAPGVYTRVYNYLSWIEPIVWR